MDLDSILCLASNIAAHLRVKRAATNSSGDRCVTWTVAAPLLLLFCLPASAAGSDPAPNETLETYAQIRLYNYRHASQLATQLGTLFPLLTLSSPAPAPAGSTDTVDDVLIAGPKAPSDSSKPPDPAAISASIGDLKRMVALLDLPRPQVTMQIWSIKVSSKNPDKIEELVKNLQQQIDERNLRIQKALKFGWFHLMSDVQKPGFLDEQFRQYISNAFVFGEGVAPQKYSLGYIHAFSPDQPSIANMLLCLAAANDPGQWVDGVVDEMEAPANDPLSPKFANFRTYLHALAGSAASSGTSPGRQGQQSALRAALADFLFQYKWAVMYPHDFVGYDLQNSATVLDGLFAPAVDGLNRDIEEYVKKIVDDEKAQLSQKGEQTQLSSRGVITVAAISGQQATVEGKIVAHFDVTQPPSLSDMVNGISSAKTNLSALFPQVTGNPALVAAALAAISAQEKTFVQIQKGMNLVITPTTLATAASAELDINLDAGDDKGQAADDADPTLIGAKKDQTYAVDRIAKHSVKTRVRVDSLKLFEVSTFSFDLMHPRPDGVVPVIGTIWQGVFGAVPGVGRLFTWHRTPEISSNRSLVVVSALIVPTSMDLALGIRVERDRKLTADGAKLKSQAMSSLDDETLLRKARPFHKKKMECLLTPPAWVTFAKPDCNCGNLTFDCIPEDFR